MFYMQRTILVVSVVLPMVAALAVAARFQARRIKNLPIKADEWLIVVALIVTIADCIGGIYATLNAGIGEPMMTQSLETRKLGFKFLYADIIIGYFTFGIIKISIILFYKRIFAVDWFLKLANIALAIVGSWTIATVLSAIFSVWPTSDFWNYYGKTDLDLGVWAICMAALDVTLDLLVLALPLPAIKGLKISFKKKLSVMAIFWLGLFCTASSGVRLWYSILVRQIADNPMLGVTQPEYTTYVANANTLWARIEACSSIIAACLPTLAPLAHTARYRTFIGSCQSKLTWLTHSSSTGNDKRQDSDDKVSSSDSDGSGEDWRGAYVRHTPTPMGDVELGRMPPEMKHGKAIIIQQSFRSKCDDRRI